MESWVDQSGVAMFELPSDVALDRFIDREASFLNIPNSYYLA